MGLVPTSSRYYSTHLIGLYTICAIAMCSSHLRTIAAWLPHPNSLTFVSPHMLRDLRVRPHIYGFFVSSSTPSLSTYGVQLRCWIKATDTYNGKCGYRSRMCAVCCLSGSDWTLPGRLRFKRSRGCACCLSKAHCGSVSAVACVGFEMQRFSFVAFSHCFVMYVCSR